MMMMMRVQGIGLCLDRKFVRHHDILLGTVSGFEKDNGRSKEAAFVVGSRLHLVGESLVDSMGLDHADTREDDNSVALVYQVHPGMHSSSWPEADEQFRQFKDYRNPRKQGGTERESRGSTNRTILAQTSVPFSLPIIMPPKQWPSARAASASSTNSIRKDSSVYSAGVKDPTGKTTEYFVSLSQHRSPKTQ